MPLSGQKLSSLTAYPLWWRRLTSLEFRIYNTHLQVSCCACQPGKTAFATIEAMGEGLEALSSVYVWPLDKRPKDAAGRHGSLHAKCAVADGADFWFRA